MSTKPESKQEEKGIPPLPEHLPSSLASYSSTVLGEWLVKAATDGLMDFVDRLLLGGANVNYETDKGYTALIKACRMQRVEVVRKLLAYDANVNGASKNGWTALIEAARVGHAGLVSELIAKGAIVDCTNVMGWIPMIEACRNRHFHVVKLLVSKGSSVDHKDKDNMTALDHTSRALTDIRSFLKGVWRGLHPEEWREEQKLKAEGKWPKPKQETDGDKLAGAALRGDLDVVKDLIKKGINVNATTTNGAYTAMIFACRSQQMAVVEELIKAKADVNKKSTAGWTPCIEASRVGNLAILKRLVEAGGDLNLTNAFGWHGLIEACRNVNYDVVEWSIENKVNVNHFDEDGECAMDHTTHPWIRGLLQGGPRNVLKKELKASKDLRHDADSDASKNVSEEKKEEDRKKREARVLNCVRTLMEKESPETADETRAALFETIVQELDPLLIEPVMNQPGFIAAIKSSKVNIIRAAILLDVPAPRPEGIAKRAQQVASHKEGDPQLRRPDRTNWPVLQCLELILKCLFKDTEEEERESFVNTVDNMTGRSAALECALKFAGNAAGAINDSARASQEGLPHSCHYLYDVIDFLLSKGAKPSLMDGAGFSILHHLLFNIPSLKDLKAAVFDCFDYADQFISKTKEKLTFDMVNSRVGTQEKTPLCFIVHANPNDLREVVLMKLLGLGASYPEPSEPGSKILEFEQTRFMALVTQAMKDEIDGPFNAWQIMVCAVRNGDYRLVSNVLKAKLPVYITDPATILRPKEEKVEEEEKETDEELQEATNVDALVDAAIKEDTEAGDSGGSGEGDYVPWKFAGREKVKENKAMGWARVDMQYVNENLIHLALEQEKRPESNIKIFEMLLDYAEEPQHTFRLKKRSRVRPVASSGDLSMTAQASTASASASASGASLQAPTLSLSPSIPESPRPDQNRHDKVEYPWPEGPGENPALTWLSSYGQNSFHILANHKQASPSATNTHYFKTLLQRDIHAVVTRLDKSGWSALHYASYHNKPDIVNQLIETRIDLQTTTSTYMKHTPLHLAALKGNWSITLALLEAGVDVDAIDKEGCTPLALAMLARQNLINKHKESSGTGSDPDSPTSSDNILGVTSVSGALPGIEGLGMAAKLAGGMDVRTDGTGRRVSFGTEMAIKGLQKQADAAKAHLQIPGAAASPADLTRMTSGSSVGDKSPRTMSRRTSEDQHVEALDRELLTYNFTIEALLNHGGSINQATAQSGKELPKLMNVEERWIQVATELNTLEELEDAADQEYFNKLDEIDEKEKKRAEKSVAAGGGGEKKGEDMRTHGLSRARKAAKELRDRKVKVLRNIRAQVFVDKENQVVIEQKYDSQVRCSRFSKLARFVVFLILLIWVGILETTRNNHTAFYLQKSLADALSLNGDENSPSFESINLDRADFYKFAKGALLDTVYPEEEAFWVAADTERDLLEDNPVAKPKPVNSKEKPSAKQGKRSRTNPKTGASSLKVTLPRGMVNHYNTLLGRPRLRQVRSRIIECEVGFSFDDLPGAKACFSDIDDEETTSFGPNDEYKYQSSWELDAPELSGRLYTYPGSGYVVDLPSPDGENSREEAEKVINQLEEDGWVDAASRAVFIEMSLYNPNENHFVVARMIIEFPLSGGAVSSWDMAVVPLRRYVSGDVLTLVVLELIVVAFLIQHAHSEWVQFAQASTNRWEYWTSFYNLLDVIVIVCTPICIGAQILSFINSYTVDWLARDSFVSVEFQVKLTSITTNALSAMVFAGCIKLFDYLSVFRGLYRLIVMIEMMIQQLVSFTIVLGLLLGSFTVSEYIAYGYKDEMSFSIGRGFIARIFGLFSGDPIVFGFTNSGSPLGTIYVMIFLLAVPLVLMNLVVAMLTSAYDEARNQSSDVLAQRQYDKMNVMGLTKRRTITFQREDGSIIKTLFTTAADDQFTSMDHFDVKFVTLVAKWMEQWESWLDQRRAAVAKASQEKNAAAKLRNKDAVFVVPKKYQDKVLSGTFDKIITKIPADRFAALLSVKTSEDPRLGTQAPRERRGSQKISLETVLTQISSLSKESS